MFTPCRFVERKHADIGHALDIQQASNTLDVDALLGEPSLKGYHLLPSVRGDLLARLGRRDEARAEFERAAALTLNTRERDLLLAKLSALEKPPL